MNGEREVVQHSDRPIALLLGVLVLATAVWLAVSSYDGGQDALVPATTTAPTTSMTTVPDQTEAAWVLDGTVGLRWWSNEGDLDGSDVEIFHLGDGITILTSAFPTEAGRAPILRRIDPVERTVLWESKGLVGGRWSSSAPARVGGSVFLGAVDQTGVELLFGFDVGSGQVRFSSPYEIVPVDKRVAQVLEVEGAGTVVLVTVVEEGISRIDPDTGAIMWSSPIPWGRVIDAAELADGRGAIAVAGPHGTVFLDPMTGLTVDSRDRIAPPASCEVARSPVASITLWQSSPPAECVVVAQDQHIEIWNKGFEAIVIAVSSAQPIVLPSGEQLSLGPAIRFLVPGTNEIESAPYPMPALWLMPRSESPSVRFELSEGRLGPASPGMTLDEASEALGLDIVLDRDATPGCLVADIAGDPYSPRFLLNVVNGNVIQQIVDRGTDVSPACL